jgi:hypothetical protein
LESLYSFDEILRAYQRQVALPWQPDLPPAGRVWIIWYDKSMQRRFTARLSEFEHATLVAGHGWRQLDLAPSFGRWIASHELFVPLLAQPAEIRGLRPEFEEHLAGLVEEQLLACTGADVLAVDGCGALFGFARISTLVSRVATAIRGRMLIGFPGKYSAGVYRLLDARDGWNYHAVPIPPDSPQ